MYFQPISATAILSPDSPVGSSRAFDSAALLSSIISAIAPIALISLLLRSQRK